MRMRFGAPGVGVRFGTTVVMLGLALVTVATLTGCDVLLRALFPPLNPTTNLGVQVEVRFLQLEDNFVDEVGVDFDEIGQTQRRSPTNSGGNPLDETVVTRGKYLGGATNTLYLAPGNRLDGPLPLAISTIEANQTSFRVFPLFDGLPQQPSQSEPVDDLPEIIDMLPDLVIGATNNGANVSGLLGALVDDTQLQQIIRNLNQADDASILSAPQVTLFDGQRAVFLAGNATAFVNNLETEYAQTIRAVDGQTIFAQSGVVLDVTPTVTSDGRITMEVQPGTQAVGFALTERVQFGGLQHFIEVPVIRQGTVRTSITIQDGQTIVLGGVIDDGQRTTGIPLLRSIPVIGGLFDQEEGIEDRTLMVLITPRIVSISENEQ